MPKYLDPKADLTFKKVFGEYPELTISFLNALLPLKDDEQITSVSYLTPEMMPDNPLRKYSIVDVRCTDAKGRVFLVEMQTVWSEEFKQRVLFNASKAYVGQLKKGKKYELLQPVYSLNLVNEVFEKDIDDAYHYYRLVHEKHSDRVIDGLHLVFVELPKFKPQNFSDKRMLVLWLRFLTEIDEQVKEAAPELLADKDINQALELVEIAAFDEVQLEAYERFWDGVRVEKAIIDDRARMMKQAKEMVGQAEEKGRAEGMAKGRAEGMAKGRAEGMAEGIKETARRMKSKGFDIQTIADLTQLPIDEIEKL